MTYDFTLEDSSELKIKNGDLLIEESTGQHQGILILAEKGTIRQHGDAGVGAMGYLLDSNTRELLREVSRQCLLDGMKVNAVKNGENGEILIDADYGN